MLLIMMDDGGRYVLTLLDGRTGRWKMIAMMGDAGDVGYAAGEGGK
jgi:hypothetical protein